MQDDFVILGAGAMGCLFGARLSRSGHPVVLVDVWAISFDCAKVEMDALVCPRSRS